MVVFWIEYVVYVFEVSKRGLLDWTHFCVFVPRVVLEPLLAENVVVTQGLSSFGWIIVGLGGS